MKVNENGIYREMTADELSEMQNFTPPVNYAEMVEIEIRKKYTVSDELAILRQKDEKPEEYDEYYEFCEKCKAYAKSITA